MAAASAARHETRALLRAHLAAASRYGHLTRHCVVCHRLLRLSMDLPEPEGPEEGPEEAEEGQKGREGAEGGPEEPGDPPEGAGGAPEGAEGAPGGHGGPAGGPVGPAEASGDESPTDP
ncbi:hypothetical protein J3A78_004089 [Streptomyces sp. PvR006]|uniref:DUF6274 family protein n=1 Tax=Streptomyces sp. PvR006 TaxID=2817860 RepID=UPI001FDAC3CE|nr:DUF6274 family protein [Streptomyces sp. PvR006]MBP2583611.1 hypothetical protein [Streptomyces sp. PvR006]